MDAIAGKNRFWNCCRVAIIAPPSPLHIVHIGTRAAVPISITARHSSGLVIVLAAILPIRSLPWIVETAFAEIPTIDRPIVIRRPPKSRAFQRRNFANKGWRRAGYSEWAVEYEKQTFIGLGLASLDNYHGKIGLTVLPKISFHEIGSIVGLRLPNALRLCPKVDKVFGARAVCILCDAVAIVAMEP